MSYRAQEVVMYMRKNSVSSAKKSADLFYESLSHVPSQPLWTVIKGDTIQMYHGDCHWLVIYFSTISIMYYSSIINDCFLNSSIKFVKFSGSG